jgi:hypothetical protein
MTTYTLARTQNRTWSFALYIGLALVILTALVAVSGSTSVKQTQPKVVNADGVWERAYLHEGTKGPGLADTGVNQGIAWVAALNARVALAVKTGADVTGNSERLMFGIK